MSDLTDPQIPDHILDGALVWYEPRPYVRRPSIVRGDARRIGSGEWIVQILDLDADRMLDVAVGRLVPRGHPLVLIPPPERVQPPMTESHTEEWAVQKIEDTIGAVRITLAPGANDDTHRIMFDVTKEEAAQYAVGGKHVITVGPRTRFWWETPATPDET